MTTIATALHQFVVTATTDTVTTTLATECVSDGVTHLHIRLAFTPGERPPEVKIAWTHPVVDVHHHWYPTTGWDRGNQVDWGNGYTTRATNSAPVNCMFSADGNNRLTFAFSDALHPVRIKAGVHEETAAFKCSITLFTEATPAISAYEATLRIDTRDIPYYQALHQVQEWWASMPNYTPAPVPETARQPMYSSWYAFHQQLVPAEIEAQCRMAKALGCDAIIVDDGWQTRDNNRGYACCGDWKPERIPEMRAHVDRVHQLGMKYLLWYSVPFVGVHSQAWQRFQGKFLDPSSPKVRVVDPRYPDVREYLISIYEQAMRDWNLDGFKLDFVDSFGSAGVPEAEMLPGYDYLSVPEACDRLLTDVMARLRSINPEVMIEFRQSYIGPLMRKYGNMFRAADCPNDAIGNRLRTLDVRLICGNTAAHADMLMWHHDDPVESAALQIVNVLFAVPQISVRLDNIPADHLAMLTFWLAFWREHRDVLLDGALRPLHPEAIYPVVIASTQAKCLVAVYSDAVANPGTAVPGKLLIVNGTRGGRVVLELDEPLGARTLLVRDCCGKLVQEAEVTLAAGLHRLDIPAAGVATLTVR